MTRTILLAASAVLMPLAAGSSQATAPIRASVVLVHGAFADGSSWNKVILLLQAKVLEVFSVQNPLTSLEEDVAFTRRAIEKASGPVVLVGHSWGGTVITEAGGHGKVKALVYVAAFAPGKGQSVLDLAKAYPTPPGLAAPERDAEGFLSLSTDTVARHFAQDATAEEKSLIAVTQGAVRGANFEQKVTTVAWETRPSWAIVAEEDHMIDSAT
jgi:pimeloyl-ACP methyl ester carboxylesterase